MPRESEYSIIALPHTRVDTHTAESLCKAGEKLFYQSMEEHNSLIQVTIGHAKLLLKFLGRRVGLALTDTEDFEAGVWYELKGQNNLDTTDAAFDRGQTTLELPDSHWVRLRGIRDCSDPEIVSSELFQLAKEYSQNMPQRLPRFITNLTRKEYRQKKFSRT